MIAPQSIYTQLRDDHVARMIALRDGSAERALIERMLSRHELVRNGTSPNLDPVQLDLLGMTPRDFGQAAVGRSGSALAARPASARTDANRQTTHR